MNHRNSSWLLLCAVILALGVAIIGICWITEEKSGSEGDKQRFICLLQTCMELACPDCSHTTSGADITILRWYFAMILYLADNPDSTPQSVLRFLQSKYVPLPEGLHTVNSDMVNSDMEWNAMFKLLNMEQLQKVSRRFGGRPPRGDRGRREAGVDN